LWIITALLTGGHVYAAVSGSDDSALVGGVFKNAVAFSIDTDGKIYVLDAGSSELVKLSGTGEEQARIGGYGWTADAFDQPTDVIAPNGLDVYVADYGNHRVQHFDRNLNFISSFARRDDPHAEDNFGYPRSVAQSRFGALFIVDGENKRVLEVSSSNDIEAAFGDIGGGEGRLQSPQRVRVSGNDLVYVQDGNQIVVFDIFGNYLETLGKNLFKHLRSFTVSRDSVYALDSCALYIFGRTGESEYQGDINIGGATTVECDAVDVAVYNEKIFILSRHGISILQMGDQNKQRKE